MCFESQKLKLCTCFEDNDAVNTWTLKKYKGADWMTLEIGRCLSLSFGEEDYKNIKFILNSLVDNKPFDFEYTPEDGDILIINLGEKFFYEFEFKANKWENKQELSKHLNKDLIIKKGIIE